MSNHWPSACHFNCNITWSFLLTYRTRSRKWCHFIDSKRAPKSKYFPFKWNKLSIRELNSDWQRNVYFSNRPNYLTNTEHSELDKLLNVIRYEDDRYQLKGWTEWNLELLCSCKSRERNYTSLSGYSFCSINHLIITCTFSPETTAVRKLFFLLFTIFRYETSQF